MPRHTTVIKRFLFRQPCFPLWLGLVPLLTAWGEAPTPNPIRVAVSLPLLKDVVENVGGPSVEVIDLLSGQGDVHVFEPTPADVRNLAKAELIYEIGLNLEPWLDSLVAASQTRARRIRLSDGIDRIPTGGHHHHHHDLEEPGDEPESTDLEIPDPHIWLDPIRMTYMVVAIGETLAEQRPEAANLFEDRALDYIAEIRKANRTARAYLDPLPEDRRSFITYHDNFRYFSEHFELYPVASILGTISTDHFDPSAEHIRDLIHLIGEEGVAGIFPEYGEPNDLAIIVAREAGIPLGPPLYGSRFDADPEGPVQTYLDLLIYNARILAETLGK